MNINEVLDFINRRWKVDCNWVSGNCYWFSKILCDRFPNLQQYYLPVTGHFIAGDGEIFFDWNGIYTIDTNENPIMLEYIEMTDSLWYTRLMRDCKY